MAGLRPILRRLARDGRSSALAVLTIGLGIGLTATIDGFLRGTVFARPPVPERDRLVAVSRVRPSDADDTAVAVRDLEAWRRRGRGFAGLGGFRVASVSVRAGDGKPVRVAAAELDREGFALAGAVPRLGRLFTPEEDRPGGAAVALVREDLWRDLLGGEPRAIGARIRIDGVEHTVVGVLPEDFGFPIDQSLWRPLRANAVRARRDEPAVEVFGVLAPGVDVGAATRDLQAIDRAVAEEDPEARDGRVTRVGPYHVWAVGADVYVFAYSMIGSVVLVLMIACVNVANLLLVRAVDRAGDVGVRVALGAGRLRILGESLLEAGVLAVLGGLLGTGIAVLGVRALAAITADARPFYWIAIRPDGLTLAVAFGLTALAAVVVAFLPALQASGVDVATVLQDRGRGGSRRGPVRFARRLVATEVAFAMVLLAAAGITIKSVSRLAVKDYGFPAERLASAQVALPDERFATPEERAALWEALRRRVEDRSEVAAAALTSSLPVGFATRAPFAIEGTETVDEQALPTARQAAVSPEYFALLGAGPLDGRLFDAGDDFDGAPVALVNRSFAERYSSDAPAVGRRLRLSSAADAPWRTVVGVVPDLWMAGARNARPEGVYVPVAQADPRQLAILVELGGPAPNLAELFAEEVAAVDADLAPFEVQSMPRWISRRAFLYWLLPSIFVVFGVAALLLAALGLFGVTSAAVGQRRREIGIRMAMGASPGAVRRQLLTQTGRQILASATVGLGVALGFNSGLSRFLVDVSPRDPIVLAAVYVLLAGVGVAAVAVPAWRASRLDPLIALRTE